MTGEKRTPALTGMIEMLSEALSSKKFVSMAATMGVTWAGLERFASGHPELAKVAIIGCFTVVCTYILGQSVVDAVIALKDTTST